MGAQLKPLEVLVHNCTQFPTIVIIFATKVPFTFVVKKPQMCTIVDDCAQIPISTFLMLAWNLLGTRSSLRSCSQFAAQTSHARNSAENDKNCKHEEI